MKNSKNISGQSLLEVLISMTLGAMVLASITGFLSPSAQLFTEGLSAENSRLKVIGTLDAIEKEATQMRALYVDPNQCYSLCMVDANSNRTYFYWGGPQGGTRHLYRKKETTNNPITCTGGSVFAADLETALSTFAISSNLLTVKIGANDANQNPQSFSNVIFPTVQERDYIFSEGFECNSLRSGWVTTNGANSSWAIQGSANSGYYRIVEGTTANTSETASIEIPIDLSRISSAHLSFSYMNAGSLVAGDTFSVTLWDGSAWQTLYSDAAGLSISSPKAIDADLSGYALNSSNKIRFSGGLRNTNAHWYIDSVSIYNP